MSRLNLNGTDKTDLTGKDRLIVALDVPTHEQAFELVSKLDNVSFFKVGLQLFMAGDMLGFIRKLQESRASQGGVFVDLKLSGDIGHTIIGLVEGCMALNVKFITLVESVLSATTVRTLQAAQQARGKARDPRLLMVPLLSSLNTDDLLHATGNTTDSTDYIVDRGKAMLQHGCDGLIVSGEAIKACREAFSDIDIVSPGIRPVWATADDHKRLTTPSQAISYGADYLVVGRPIYNAKDPRGAAQKIIDEIDQVQEEKTGPATMSATHHPAHSLAASPA